MSESGGWGGGEDESGGWEGGRWERVRVEGGKVGEGEKVGR